MATRRDATGSHPGRLQSAERYERRSERRAATAGKLRSRDSGHHSDRRYLDRAPCAKSPLHELRAAQQAGETARIDAGDPEACWSHPARSGRRPTPAARGAGKPTVFVVDDDDQVREAMRAVLEDDGSTRRGLSELRGVSRRLSSRDGSMPADRRLSAWNEWARIAAEASRDGHTCRRS